MGLISFLKEKFSKKKKTENAAELQLNGKNYTNSSDTSDNNSYQEGLKRSRKEFAVKLKNLSKKYSKANTEYFNDVERTLIEADVGVGLTLDTVSKLTDIALKKKITDINELNDELFDILFSKYLNDGEEIQTDFDFSKSLPVVAFIVGVNGVGKTTSIAKLAYRYKQMGKKILLVAGDTFRAGAKEQLSIWASRLNVDIVTGKQDQDPASLVFEGCKKAKENNYDLLIIDTAGRLQTKVNLMNELSKMNKIISKELPESSIERLLVLDATTGQNGVIQAKSFFEATSLSGIIITKMDGTSKGGIILAIKNELNIPVRFIGLGEKETDLQPFDLEKYIYSLCVVGDQDE